MRIAQVPHSCSGGLGPGGLSRQPCKGQSPQQTVAGDTVISRPRKDGTHSHPKGPGCTCTQQVLTILFPPLCTESLPFTLCSPCSPCFSVSEVHRRWAQNFGLTKTFYSFFLKKTSGKGSRRSWSASGTPALCVVRALDEWRATGFGKIKPEDNDVLIERQRMELFPVQSLTDQYLADLDDLADRYFRLGLGSHRQIFAGRVHV